MAAMIGALQTINAHILINAHTYTFFCSPVLRACNSHTHMPHPHLSSPN
jgi:hypothetical protein